MREFIWIRKHLDRDTTMSVANAIVGSRIEYCNEMIAQSENKLLICRKAEKNYLICRKAPPP